MPDAPAVPAGSAERDTAVCDLVAGAMARFGALRLKVSGCSMLPSIWPGDVLSIQKANLRNLSPADVVVFRRGSRLFAHRLLRTVTDAGSTYLATRGDGLEEPDLPVWPADVLGRVIRVERGPFRLDPRAPTGPSWRLAWAVLEGGRSIRRLVSRQIQSFLARSSDFSLQVAGSISNLLEGRWAR